MNSESPIPLPLTPNPLTHRSPLVLIFLVFSISRCPPPHPFLSWSLPLLSLYHWQAHANIFQVTSQPIGVQMPWQDVTKQLGKKHYSRWQGPELVTQTPAARLLAAARDIRIDLEFVDYFTKQNTRFLYWGRKNATPAPNKFHPRSSWPNEKAIM